MPGAGAKFVKVRGLLLGDVLIGISAAEEAPICNTPAQSAGCFSGAEYARIRQGNIFYFEQ